MDVCRGSGDAGVGFGRLWRHATPRERGLAIGGAIAVLVLGALAVLELAMLVPALLVLLAQATVLARYRRRVCRARPVDSLAREAERGVVQLEKWLASRRHA